MNFCLYEIDVGGQVNSAMVQDSYRDTTHLHTKKLIEENYSRRSRNGLCICIYLKSAHPIKTMTTDTHVHAYPIKLNNCVCKRR